MLSLVNLFISCVALSTSVAAFSIPKPIRSQQFTDTFDNVTGIPGVTIFPVGYQNDLNYNQLQLGSPLNVGLGGVTRASPPNAATISERNILQTGKLSVNPTATVFKDGNIKYFKLDQFFFGCTGNTGENAANVAVGCGISVTGYDIYGKMVGDASYNYAPATLMQAPMVRAVLPSYFVGLQNVTFGISTSSITPTETALLLDNVTHTNYY